MTLNTWCRVCNLHENMKNIQVSYDILRLDIFGVYNDNEALCNTKHFTKMIVSLPSFKLSFQLSNLANFVVSFRDQQR